MSSPPPACPSRTFDSFAPGSVGLRPTLRVVCLGRSARSLGCILSDQFLAEVRGLKHKNVAAELLEKLLKDELKVRSKRNLVQSQVFSEKLKKTHLSDKELAPPGNGGRIIQEYADRGRINRLG